MSQGIKIANGDVVAARLHKRLSPGCDKCEVAGSVRRGVNLVSDVELVVLPQFTVTGLFAEQNRSQIDPILSDMKLGGHLGVIKDGPKYKQFMLASLRPPIMFDLYIADHVNWGLILMIRTGSATFSRNAVTQRKYGGFLHNEFRVREGYVWNGGKMFPVPEEAEFFNLLSCGWVDPADR